MDSSRVSAHTPDAASFPAVGRREGSASRCKKGFCAARWQILAMLSKNLRLPTEEFRAGSYCTIRTPYFLLKIKKNTMGNVRIGVVVSVAVSKSAAKRNFWKRQVKTILLATAKKEARDILVIISPKVSDLTKKQFREKLTSALRAAR